MIIWFKTGTFKNDFKSLLLDPSGSLILSSENPLGFHAKVWSLLAILKNIYRITETLHNFACHHLQNDFSHRNNLNKTLESLFYLVLRLILLCF